jgi:glucoamylase
VRIFLKVAFFCFGIQLTQPANASIAQSSLNNPLKQQYQASIQAVFNNMQSNGAVVASPSQGNQPGEPNYYYDWVRDTSLTMKTLIQVMMNPSTAESLRKQIHQKVLLWIQFELNRQTVQTLTGLGEPRFYVNGQSNHEPWGRPQNDGPALRALTAMEYARALIAAGRFQEVSDRLYRAELPARTLIKRDLEYVAHHWRDSSFDLWEEVRGYHFYTLTAQKMALVHGAAIANLMNDPQAAQFYQAQASAIQNLLGQFVVQNKIKVTLDSPHQGMAHKSNPDDVAVLLSAIQTYDQQGFHVPTGALHQTVLSLVNAFEYLYEINKVKTDFNGARLGTAVGRYPEDVYDGAGFSGGNPWFLATLGLAEYYCRIGWKDQAQNQFRRVLHHRGNSNALAEQFDRKTGYQRGARQLTWSHTAFISAYLACL